MSSTVFLTFFLKERLNRPYLYALYVIHSLELTAYHFRNHFIVLTPDGAYDF